MSLSVSDFRYFYLISNLYFNLWNKNKSTENILFQYSSTTTKFCLFKDLRLKQKPSVGIYTVSAFFLIELVFQPK